jgi:hypothetical protein
MKVKTVYILCLVLIPVMSELVFKIKTLQDGANIEMPNPEGLVWKTTKNGDLVTTPNSLVIAWRINESEFPGSVISSYFAHKYTEQILGESVKTKENNKSDEQAQKSASRKLFFARKTYPNFILELLNPIDKKFIIEIQDNKKMILIDDKCSLTDVRLQNDQGNVYSIKITKPAKSFLLVLEAKKIESTKNYVYSPKTDLPVIDALSSNEIKSYSQRVNKGDIVIVASPQLYKKEFLEQLVNIVNKFVVDSNSEKEGNSKSESHDVVSKYQINTNLECELMISRRKKAHIPTIRPSGKNLNANTEEEKPYSSTYKGENFPRVQEISKEYDPAELENELFGIFGKNEIDLSTYSIEELERELNCLFQSDIKPERQSRIREIMKKSITQIASDIRKSKNYKPFSPRNESTRSSEAINDWKKEFKRVLDCNEKESITPIENTIYIQNENNEIKNSNFLTINKIDNNPNKEIQFSESNLSDFQNEFDSASFSAYLASKLISLMENSKNSEPESINSNLLITAGMIVDDSSQENPFKDSIQNLLDKKKENDFLKAKTLVDIYSNLIEDMLKEEVDIGGTSRLII